MCGPALQHSVVIQKFTRGLAKYGKVWLFFKKDPAKMGPFFTRDPATSSSPLGGRAFSSKVSIGSNAHIGLYFNKEVAKTGLIFKKKSADEILC